MISILYRLTLGHAQKLRVKGTGEDLEIRSDLLVEISRLNLWDIVYLIGFLRTLNEIMLSKHLIQCLALIEQSKVLAFIIIKVSVEISQRERHKEEM